MNAHVAPALVTFNDIDIAARLVDALVAHVTAASPRPPAPLDYEALLVLARSRHPRDAALGRAVGLGVGPKLQLVASFCRQHGYPNLAALALPPASDGSPSAFGAADWTGMPAQLDAAVKAWRATVPARIKPRAERPADVTWYAWFRTHRAECAHVTTEGKKEIINLMMAGLDPEAALRRVLAAQGNHAAAPGTAQ